MQDKIMVIHSSDSKDLLQELRKTLLPPALCGELVHLLYNGELRMLNVPAEPTTNR